MRNLKEIQDILRENFHDFRQRFGVRSLSIFGSYVRNEQTEKSDVDILVEYDSPISLFELMDTELYLGDLLSTKVDLILKRSIRHEIRENVLREAVAV